MRACTGILSNKILQPIQPARRAVGARGLRRSTADSAEAKWGTGRTLRTKEDATAFTAAPSRTSYDSSVLMFADITVLRLWISSTVSSLVNHINSAQAGPPAGFLPGAPAAPIVLICPSSSPSPLNNTMADGRRGTGGERRGVDVRGAACCALTRRNGRTAGSARAASPGRRRRWRCCRWRRR
jgi:hypothetical protein